MGKCYKNLRLTGSKKRPVSAFFTETNRRTCEKKPHHKG